MHDRALEHAVTLMRIACLAWGSLVWKRGALALSSPWQAGGPWLPIEFSRVGDGGELATALWEEALPVTTRWALLDLSTLDEAREQLRQREGIAPDKPGSVGDTSASWQGPHQTAIADWARAQRLDLVVWTALPPRFDGEEGRAPSADQAVAYLQALSGRCVCTRSSTCARCRPRCARAIAACSKRSWAGRRNPH